MANQNYVRGELARALHTAQSHEDSATRARAEQRAQRFTRVLDGMLAGSLEVGSRTPVAATPAWTTLEVARGGFATGALLAGGPLLAHEQALRERLGLDASYTGRAALNAYFLTELGLAELEARLADGCYRLEVPEEGALLVVAWLLANHRRESAGEVLEALAPFFDTLRFYPTPAEAPPVVSAFVHLQPVGATARALEVTRTNTRVARMNETLRVWSPLEDRVVALVRETVVEAQPFALRTDEWTLRARALLEEYRALAQAHTLCKRHTKPKENLARLLTGLRLAVEAPLSLDARVRGAVRASLADIARKRGAPEALLALRATQSAVAARPSHRALGHVLAKRLAALPQDGGIESLEPFVAPLVAAEAASLGVPAGQAIPASLTRKLERSLDAPVESLVARGVIPSGEVLAQVTPQLTAQVRAAGLRGADLRRLYSHLYTAFRRRRSLLLVNLEHQVRMEELPWVAALERERDAGLDAQTASRQTLEQLATLAFTSFPYAVLPNKLLREFGALAKGAGVELPLTEELAADIFMNAFTPKFVAAAKSAARLLKGTPYERYYALPFDRVLAMRDVPRSREARQPAAHSREFAELCIELAGPQGVGSSVARNGTVIEQQQLLTTHNVAALFELFGLAQALGPELEAMARRSFERLCSQFAQGRSTWRAQLQRMKNAAYTWRQMLFFLSLAPEGALQRFAPWAASHFGAQGAEFRTQFAPVMRGLRSLAAGGADERPFLGWTVGRHWLFADEKK